MKLKGLKFIIVLIIHSLIIFIRNTQSAVMFQKMHAADAQSITYRNGKAGWTEMISINHWLINIETRRNNQSWYSNTASLRY